MESEVKLYAQEEKERLIKTEKARLTKVFEKMQPGKKTAIIKLIDESAFMAVTLSEARAIINRDGLIETYQNGANQSGLKKSAVVEVYDKMVNTYAKIMKQLCDLMPEDEIDETSDIMKFIRGN